MTDYVEHRRNRLDGSGEPLLIREVANKIIHAERYEWAYCPLLTDSRYVPTLIAD